jgi:hypothetical protein
MRFLTARSSREPSLGIVCDMTTSFSFQETIEVCSDQVLAKMFDGEWPAVIRIFIQKNLVLGAVCLHFKH